MLIVSEIMIIWKKNKYEKQKTDCNNYMEEE